MLASCLCFSASCVVCYASFPESPSAYAPMLVLPSLFFIISASSSAFTTPSAFPPMSCFVVVPLLCNVAWLAAIVVPICPSAPSPASAIAPALGLDCAALLPKPSTPPPAPIFASWLPTAPAAVPRCFASITTAGSARTGSKSSRTASMPTGLAVIASWPMRFVCSCTPLPTTWSTGSASICLLPYVLLRSKPCVPSCSKSELGFGKPPAACVSTWPVAGLSSLCFKPWPDSPTPAKLFVSFRTYSLLTVAGGALSQNAFRIAGYLSLALPSPNLSHLLPLTLDSNHCSAHFPVLVNNAG